MCRPTALLMQTLEMPLGRNSNRGGIVDIHASEMEMLAPPYQIFPEKKMNPKKKWGLDSLDKTAHKDGIFNT